MSVYAYDPDNWLVSTHRSIENYVRDQLQALDTLGPDVEVEMGFPDTATWTKTSPLDKIFVHFEQDDQDDPSLGFGQPGVEEYDEANGLWRIQEAAWHVLDFDVGVWVSPEMGGATKRMETVQALKNLFTTAGGKQAFNDATEGLNVVSFSGGRNALDRINDLPVWRAMEMTLIVRVFSRHIPPTFETVPMDFEQDQNLTIVTDDGNTDPVETP